jgi:hypothetical protein
MLPTNHRINPFKSCANRQRFITDEQLHILQTTSEQLFQKFGASLTSGDTETQHIQLPTLPASNHQHYSSIRAYHVHVHPIYVNHGVDRLNRLISPLNQLRIQPSHESADGLMADMAAEELLGQLRQTTRTGTQ